MPRRFGFGLGFSLSRLSGIPREPSGFVAKYTAYLVSNFTLVTGSNVSQWDDESVNANNLTQATSANQPTFNDDGVSVTQSTLANQPTLIDTGGGVLAVQYDTVGDKVLNGNSDFGLSGSKTMYVEWKASVRKDSTGESSFGTYCAISDNTLTGTRDILTILRQGTSTVLNFIVADSTEVDRTLSGAIPDDSEHTWGFKADFNTGVLELWLDGALVDSNTLNTSDTIISRPNSILRLGSNINSLRANQEVYSLKVYKSVSDPTNITETPDFELLPDVQYIPSGVGQPVPTWYATQHNQYANTVNFDATDDNMTPLPTTTGDFAMQFKKKANTLATTKVLFSSSTTSAEVRLNTSNQFEVVSDVGTVFTFTTTLVASQQEVNIIQRSGNNLEVYNSIGVKQVIDVTGEAFTFDRISDTTNASDSDWQEIRIYDEILDQDSIDYFYYLRNANNEILLPPLLPS